MVICKQACVFCGLFIDTILDGCCGLVVDACACVPLTTVGCV